MKLGIGDGTSFFSCAPDDDDGDAALDPFLLSGAQQQPMAACSIKAKSVASAAIHIKTNILPPMSQ